MWIFYFPLLIWHQLVMLKLEGYFLLAIWYVAFIQCHFMHWPLAEKNVFVLHLEDYIYLYADGISVESISTIPCMRPSTCFLCRRFFLRCCSSSSTSTVAFVLNPIIFICRSSRICYLKLFIGRKNRFLRERWSGGSRIQLSRSESSSRSCRYVHD